MKTYFTLLVELLSLIAFSKAFPQNINWFPIQTPYLNAAVNSISLDPDGRVFLTTLNHELYKSADSCKTWEYYFGGKDLVAADDDGNIFSGGQAGLLTSRDRGNTWIRDSVVLNLEWLTSIEITKSTHSITCGTRSGVFLSTNSGKEWTRARLDANASYLATYFTRKGFLLSCAYSKGTFRKRVNDTTWESIQNTAMKRVHRFLELKDNRILAVGDSGILVSTDDGAQWQVVSPVLKSVFCTSADAYNNSIVLVGTQKRGLLFSQDEGKTWTWKNSGLPDTANLLIYDICIDKSGVAYLATSKGVFRSQQPVTEMQREQTLAASNFVLHQNYPNPFHPSTTIPLEITSERGIMTSLSIWSSSGRKMKTLFEGELTKGLHEFSFDGAGLAAGIYFIKTVIGNEQRILRAHLVK